MEKTKLDTISGWFAGRLPDGWFTGAPSVTSDDKQVLVVGTLEAPGLPDGTSAETRAGAESGRIARFREETRGHRIGIAREAEERFKKYVTWGAKLDGVTKRFNPGGGGRGGDDRRSVMIRRWMRRHRGRHAQEAERQSQTF